MDFNSREEAFKRPSDISSKLSEDCEKLISRDLLEKLDDNSSVFKAVTFENTDEYSFPVENPEIRRKKTWQKPQELLTNPNFQYKYSKTPKPNRSRLPFEKSNESLQVSLGNDFWSVQNKRAGWVCCQCRNFNYENRKQCNLCGKPKSNFVFGKKNQEICDFFEQNNLEIPKICLEKTKKLVVREGDWSCAECSNINFSFRDTCNRCGVARDN